MKLYITKIIYQIRCLLALITPTLDMCVRNILCILVKTSITACMIT